jgi:hypothetical protein
MTAPATGPTAPALIVGLARVPGTGTRRHAPHGTCPR